MLGQVVGQESSVGASHEAMGCNQSDSSAVIIQQNKLLTSKIQLIEMQNMEQQKRLQQLEDLILELRSAKKPIEDREQKPLERTFQEGVALRKENGGYFCDPVVMQDLADDDQMLQDNCMKSNDLNPILRNSEFSIPRDLTATEHRESFESYKMATKYCFNKSHISPHNLRVNQLPVNVEIEQLRISDDVQSIMEEFDRNARENGLKYGMTPEGSVVGSEDVGECEEAAGNDSFKYPISVVEDPGVCNLDIPTSPASELLTPSYQCVRTTHTQYPGENGPVITPQPCLTTPVLLTSEALRAVEKAQNHGFPSPGQKHNRFSGQKHNWFSQPFSFIHSNVESEEKWSRFSDLKRKKVNPFTNLLSGLRQASKPLFPNNGFQNDSSSSVSLCDKWQQESILVSSKMSTQKPGCSPAHSYKSVNSSYIKEWTQSVKLPFLSPMSENHVGWQQSPTYCSPKSHSSTRIGNWCLSMRLENLSPNPESPYGDKGFQLHPPSPSSNNDLNQSQCGGGLVPLLNDHPGTVELFVSSHISLFILIYR